jgi:regulatory protein
MKLTSIKQQVKNPDRVSIFVDGKYVFSLSLDELVKYKLKNGDDLTQADVKKYKKISEDGKLRARALEWLMNRPHSEREFRDYLYRKKAEPELIEKFIEEFTEKKYLDNYKFAQWFIDLQERRGKSDRAINAELSSEGINREIVSEIFEDRSTGESERIKKIMAKKQNLSRYKNDPQKLMQYLAAKGFSWQDIKDALATEQPEDSA